MRKRIIGFVFFLFPALGIFSQQYLDLQTCRNLAIENNKTLKMATEEEKMAYYQKKDAITKYFPELSFVGTYLRNGKNLNLLPGSIHFPDLGIPGLSEIIPPGTEIPIPGEIRKLGEIEIKNIWAGGFNLIQPVFMGGKIIAYNDIQKYAEELAKSKKDTQLTEVIVETDNAYWQVVSLAHKKRLAESYVELLQKMESDIENMEAEGVATKADVLTVNVKLNEAEMTRTKAENGLSLSKMFLCQLCGLDITENITLKDESASSLNVEEADAVIPNVNEALANRDEIKSLDLAVKMYKKQENIAVSEFLPQISFTANYLWTNPNLFNGFEKKFGGMWNIGLMVKVPFNFVSNSAKLNSAKAQTALNRFKLEDTKEKIELQVNQSAYKLSEANKKLRTAEKNMEKANENLRYANVGFEEGVIPASDVLAAHTAWMSAHSEYIDAQIDIKLCKLYLDKAMGRTLSLQ